MQDSPESMLSSTLYQRLQEESSGEEERRKTREWDFDRNSSGSSADSRGEIGIHPIPQPMESSALKSEEQPKEANSAGGVQGLALKPAAAAPTPPSLAQSLESSPSRQVVRLSVAIPRHDTLASTPWLADRGSEPGLDHYPGPGPGVGPTATATPRTWLAAVTTKAPKRGINTPYIGRIVIHLTYDDITAWAADNERLVIKYARTAATQRTGDLDAVSNCTLCANHSHNLTYFLLSKLYHDANGLMIIDRRISRKWDSGGPRVIINMADQIRTVNTIPTATQIKQATGLKPRLQAILFRKKKSKRAL
jgi:hypothetical protein